MKWSDAQRDAIETEGKNLLVAAAAGSGKTAVLVERIIRRIMNGTLDVDKLLVVTFTNAAAAEMRERIESALVKEQEKNPGNKNVKKQLALLSNASISTMHAFCQTVIRRNFASIHMDPKFRLAGEQEVRLLKQEVMEELFERYYEESNSDFLYLAETYGSERGDEELHALVNRLFTFSESQPFPEAWLMSLSDRFSLSADVTILKTAWGKSILRDLKLALERMREDHDTWREKASLLDADFYEETRIEIEALIRDVGSALDVGEWDAIGIVLKKEFPKMKRAPKGTPDAIKEPFKALRESIKETFDSLVKRYFHTSEAELLDDLRRLQPTVSKVVRVVIDFRRAYRIKKQEKGIADFSDLEHFALEILLDEGSEPDSLKPSKAALALKEKYHEVMVDEYQDTNGVQEAILQLVARNNNLFTVGDVKQSIYRFRLADPSLFLGKYQRYPQEPKLSERIVLKENFRSRSDVLRAINFLFAQLMQEETMELAYDDDAALHPGLEYPDGDNLLTPEVEFVLIDRDNETAAERSSSEEIEDLRPPVQEDTNEEELKGFELEAIEIAKRLYDLKCRGTQIYDKRSESYRPMVWRDVAILLRSVQDKGEVLIEALRSFGIPAFAATNGGYFEQTEVRIMLALLAVIDNARQDIPLAAVLHSPMVGLSLEELAVIRMEEREDDLFAALIKAGGVGSTAEESVRKKIDSFLRQLRTWRILARRVSVPELIWQLYRDTGYYEYAGGLPGGLLRQANLRMLSDRAADYEATNYRGLFRFLRYVERLQQLDTDLSSARTLGEGEDVVRVMTIHKSKGLEFPIVFLADLDKKFNLRDTTGDFLLHREMGLGVCITDRKKSLRYSTIAREAVALKIMEESKAEELRILYVALTRAREKLILVGALKKMGKRVTHWCRFADRSARELPGYAVLDAKSYLDWIGMCVVRHEDGEPICKLSADVLQHVRVQDADDCRWKVDIIPAIEVKPKIIEEHEADDMLLAMAQRTPLKDADMDSIAEILSWQYPYKESGEIVSKITVSEIKRRFSGQGELSADDDGLWNLLPMTTNLPKQQREEDFCRPAFLQEKSGMRADEYGTVLHTVLQHISLQHKLDAKRLQEELLRLRQEEFLTEEEMDAVRIKELEKFFSSSVGHRLQKAKRIWRELPFSRTLPANHFYDTAEEETKVFLQGVIDVLFQEADGQYILLDYKTDWDTEPDRIKEKYGVQIRLYREAVENMLGVRVSESYLVLLKDGTTVRI